MKTTIISQSPLCIEVSRTQEEWFYDRFLTNMNQTVGQGVWKYKNDWTSCSFTTDNLSDGEIYEMIDIEETIIELLIPDWKMDPTNG